MLHLRENLRVHAWSNTRPLQYHFLMCVALALQVVAGFRAGRLILF
jgi:hypothetical protein